LRNFTPLLAAGIDNIVPHIVTGSCYYTSFSFAIRLMFFCYVVRCTAVRLCFLQACKREIKSSVSENGVTDEGYYSFDLILGWCILLRLYFNENDSSTFVRNLSCLYCT
jgi:hypothetical protein